MKVFFQLNFHFKVDFGKHSIMVPIGFKYMQRNICSTLRTGPQLLKSMV